MEVVEQVLVFKIGNSKYCIDSSRIDQIIKIPQVTFIPLANSIVKGVCSIKGNVVSVLDITSIITNDQLSVNKASQKSRLVTMYYQDILHAFFVEDIVNNIVIDESVTIEAQSSDSQIIDGVIKIDGEIIQIVSFHKLIEYLYQFKKGAKNFNLQDKPIETLPITDESNIKPYLIFKMGEESFALNSELIREIILKTDNITNIADAKPTVLGLITLRDEIIITVDMREVFQTKKTDSKDNRFIIIEIAGQVIGILVDAIIDISQVDVNQIEDMPEKHRDSRIKGVINKSEDEIISVIHDDAIKKIVHSLKQYDVDEKSEEKSVSESDTSKRLIPFKISNEEYACDVEIIEEIIKAVKITNIPNTNSYILGVINLRGSIIPIISMHEKLNVREGIKITDDSKILIANVHDMKIGFFVDEITGIIDVHEKNITHNESHNNYFPEIIILKKGKRIILKMDIVTILDPIRLEQMKEMEI